MFVPVLGMEPRILNLWDDFGLAWVQKPEIGREDQGAGNREKRSQDGPENYGSVGYDLNASLDFIY